MQQNAIKGTLDKIHGMVAEERFEDWLSSPPNMREKQEETQKLHKEGTGDWLLENDTFVEWQDYGGTLWIRGLSGSGKSVLCSAVINSLKDDRQLSEELGHPPAIAFFYFDFRHEKTQAVDVSLRRIVLQLSAQSPNSHAVLERYYRSSNGQISPTYKDLRQILHDLLLELPRAYIVFDALDECDETELGRLFDILDMLRRWRLSPLHLLFTSQPRAIFTSGFDGVTCIDLQSTVIRDDVKFFVESELQDNRKLAIYRTADNIERIVTKSSGMFRLAACLLVELSRSRRHDLEITLQNLPSDLFGIYDRFMEAIPPQDLVYATGVLRWLSYAKPFYTNVDNLADAISFKFSTTSEYIYDPDLHDENITLIPGWLEGLITIDANNRVELAHSSVHQYFLSKRFTHKFGFDLSSSPSHTFIAQSCLGYLLHFTDKVLPDGKRYELVIYAADNWYFHVKQCHDHTVLFDNLLRLLDKGSKQYENLIRLRSYRDNTSLRPRRHNRRISSPLYLCSKDGYTEAVSLLLANGHDVNQPEGKYGNVLQAACVNGHTETAQVLLDRGAEVNREGGKYGFALRAASSKGNTATVALLLNSGADINAQDARYGSALQASCTTGKTETVELLLAHGAAIDAQGGMYGSALQAACVGKHDDTVKLLLQHGAAPNLKGGQFGTALQAASKRYRTETVVYLLLEHGAEVNVQGGMYGGALQAACTSSGSPDVVRLLLECGADVNAQGGLYGNALQASCEGKDNLETVQLLLDYGAAVNAHGGPYGSALQAASFSGNTNKIQLLLDHGAEVNKRGGMYGSALGAASWGDPDPKTAAVRLLLENGADSNAPGGRCLLMGELIAEFVPEVVPILPLIYSDDELKQRFGCFRGPLDIAIMKGERHGGVATLLLEHGAVATGY
ncbi:ankyrin repeat-containing domain protein [Mycena crocata]|nr:ankyrin repeat-containing domain protein [Mycena crocata]